MTERTQAILEEGFVLHSRFYGETSLIVNLFSRNFGKLAVIAKGARRSKSKYSGVLQPFRLLRLSWTGKTSLLNLTGVEAVLPVLQLSGSSLFCGFYLNELLHRFIDEYDPHPDLFDVYFHTLTLLDVSDSIEESLRYFELRLLNELGYGLQIEYESKTGEPIDPSKFYHYQVDMGPIEVKPGKNSVRGATLISLRSNTLDNMTQLREAKRLLRYVLDYHMGGKPLMSRSLFLSHPIKKLRKHRP